MLIHWRGQFLHYYILMSTAQYRRIIKGNWSNTNEQKRLDNQIDEQTEFINNSLDQEDQKDDD